MFFLKILLTGYSKVIQADLLNPGTEGLSTAATTRLGKQLQKNQFPSNVRVVPIDIRRHISKVAPKYSLVYLYQFPDEIMFLKRLWDRGHQNFELSFMDS